MRRLRSPLELPSHLPPRPPSGHCLLRRRNSPRLQIQQEAPFRRALHTRIRRFHLLVPPGQPAIPTLRPPYVMSNGYAAIPGAPQAVVPPAAQETTIILPQNALVCAPRWILRMI
ncbi:hypothetical protein PIB30_046489 [Stylosanthes scabra]|uniref:Uncharacterized protein n=1 Tax=Stylosanthes scabra TaxID=79078 RepID=A0ABU6VEX1_9FABA|nr:hypothetical protein [Stylosanthes scabra]